MSIHVPCIKDIFLDFLYLERATGHAVATVILSLLAKHGLDASQIRGQSYDGASSMSGIRNGTQAIIQQKYPPALYTHCSRNALSLAIAKSCSVQEIRNMIDVIYETFLFFSQSPKHQRFLEYTLDAFAPESRVQKLKDLCKTRWVERHDCLETIQSLYSYIFACFDAIIQPQCYPSSHKLSAEPDWDWDTNTKTKATGLLNSLKCGKNIVALVILVNSLDYVKGIASKLQKRNLDVVVAYKLIGSTIEDIKDVRKISMKSGPSGTQLQKSLQLM